MRSFFRSTRALLLVLAGVAGVMGFQASPAGAETTATFSIGGKAVTPDGVGISGVTVKIDGTTQTALTSDTGDYLFPSLPAGTYNLIPAKPGLIFDPLYRSVTLPATTGDFIPNARARFVGKPAPLSVAGLVKDGNGVALPGVNVALVPAVQPSTIPNVYTKTGTDGRYRFDNVPKGGYVVHAGLDQYTFSPTGVSLSLPTTGLEYSPNGRANFVGTKTVVDYKVFGKITTAAGVAVPGVKLYNTTAITDTTVPVAVTGTDGRWVVEHLKAGKYYYIPKAPGFTFDPVYGAVDLPTAGQEWSPNGRLLFTAIPVVPTSFGIRGKVINAKGYGMLGVTITIGNGLKTTTTDSNGDYHVGDLPAGDYTVTPSKTNFSFTPTSKTVTLPTTGDPNSPGATCNFSGQENVVKYAISGKVQNTSAVALAGVTLTLSNGATTTTSTTGEYSFTGLVAGSYTVTPSRTNFTFTPVSKTVTLPTSGETNSPNGFANFYGQETVVKYNIGGKVVNGSGTALAGVTMTLGSTGLTATTSTTGEYQFTGLAAGTYVVTPSKTNFTFQPTSASVAIPTTGQTYSPNGKADFKGTESTNAKYTIYGQVKVSSTSAALPGVAVTLNDGTTVLATSNADGNFYIANLGAGQYTLHLTLNGYTFDPSTPTVTFPLTSGASYYKFDILASSTTP